MTPERWEHIKELLNAALDLAGADRRAFIDEACEADDALRKELVSLLAAYEETGLVDNPAGTMAASLFTQLHATSMEGQRIGPYEIVREVGRGGMGAVFLAKRSDEQFEQRVALKVVRGGVAAPQLKHRFLAERQILARLAHPHIARLLDGGLTDHGEPYFAMEFVDGVPLDTYCDERRLSIEQRLSLFESVCEAVQYAHQNLIVHRDLKPTNILVTEAGVVKLLDFGIAKLLDAEAEGVAAPLTMTGMQVMTPEYASPEQVRGEPITTASDVYALGVLLYELLTGYRPYHLTTRTPGEVERVVCQQQPPRPSTMVRQASASPTLANETRQATPEVISHARSIKPDHLRRRLSGDLDTIILKALQKEPERRYASAEKLLDDIRRHQAGLPVQARPDAWSYRARKFVRRHRLGVMAATVVLLALLFGIIGTTWQARVASEERDRARLEAAKAEQVATFLIDMFEVADPSESLGETITARAILDRGAARVEEELSEQEEVQAQMMDVMGRVYYKLGLFEPATNLLERALSIRRDLYPEDHADVAKSLFHRAVLFVEAEEYEAAESLYTNALTIQRRVLGGLHPDVAETLHNLGQVFHYVGDYDTTDSLYQEALSIRRGLPDLDDEALTSSLHDLAVLRHDQAAYDEAEALYGEALALSEKRWGAVHPEVAVSKNNLARLYYDQGRLDEAIMMFEEVLAMRQQMLGPEHPDVATSMNNLAILLHEKEDLEGAEALYRQALEIRRKTLGPEHTRVAIALNNLAFVVRDKGDLDQAEALFREALAMRRRTLGEEHQSVATGLHNLAGLLHQKKAFPEAEALYLEALSMRRTLLSETHPNLAISLNGLAALRFDRGAYSEAEPLFREALDIRQNTLGEDHWVTAQVMSALGGCLTALQRYDEAEPPLLQGYRILVEKRGAQDALTQEALQHLATLYAKWDKPGEAARYQSLLTTPSDA